MRLTLFCSAFALLSASALHAQTPSPPVQTSSQGADGSGHSCPVVLSHPTPGDALLASKRYREAEAGFRSLLAKEPGSEDARLGIVRSLIGEDNITEARGEAAEFLKARPKSAVAEVAASEAAYRAADVQSAFDHAKAALENNRCEGRAFAAMAKDYEISGLFASSAKFIGMAHELRPNDELIRRDWIESLPRRERTNEMGKYLSSNPALSSEDLLGYSNALDHLKAHKSGDCHLSSHLSSTKTPMQPVFGQWTFPIAWGLDVSVNGKNRRMQIDTGVSGIVLTENAARGLGLNPEYHLKTTGVGDEGETDSYLTHVQSIRIGDVEITNCMVEVISKRRLDVDGLIGMDVFSPWLVSLDYQNTELRLDPLPPRPGGSGNRPALDSETANQDNDVPKDQYVAPEMKTWMSVFRIGHEIFLPASFKKGTSKHYVIMDTGSISTAVSLAMAKEIGKLHISDAQIMGISGRVNKTYETDSTQLTVGNLALPPAVFLAYDITNVSHANGFETSGFLGLRTIQRLTIQIDYRDNLVNLHYDPNHDVRHLRNGRGTG